MRCRTSVVWSLPPSVSSPLRTTGQKSSRVSTNRPTWEWHPLFSQGWAINGVPGPPEYTSPNRGPALWPSLGIGWDWSPQTAPAWELGRTFLVHASQYLGVMYLEDGQGVLAIKFTQVWTDFIIAELNRQKRAYWGIGWCRRRAGIVSNWGDFLLKEGRKSEL